MHGFEINNETLMHNYFEKNLPVGKAEIKLCRD
jgi:hypothetical protein